MGDIQEVLFTSTLDNARATCCVHDLHTGTELMKYKGGGTMQPRSLDLLKSHYLVAANSTKPLVHVWPVNGQEQMSTVRFVVPGKVDALAVSPNGAFLVAGIQGTIYIWHLESGRMLNTLSKHFQAVTCLRFSDNGEHFVSAGRDGAVLVWNFTFAASPLLVPELECNSPVYSFYEHGLTVTDVHIGHGGIHSYLYTVSLDRCCKVFDLNSGTLLLSVVFGVALHSVVANALESNVYVGTGDGQVHVFNLNTVPRMKEYHMEEEKSQTFMGHIAGFAVTCLALTMNGLQLISGAEDGNVCIWHVGSKQLIKTLPQNGPVTNLRVRLTNPDIFQPEYKHPHLFTDSLQRMISADNDDVCLEMLIDKNTHKPKKVSEPFLDLDPDKAVGGELDEENITDTAVKAQDGHEVIVSEIIHKDKKGKKSKRKKRKGDFLNSAVAEQNGKPDDPENLDYELMIMEPETIDKPEKENKSTKRKKRKGDSTTNNTLEDGTSSSNTTKSAKHKKRNTDEALNEPKMDSTDAAGDGDVKSLIVENERLKLHSKKMFQLMFNYVSNSPKKDKPTK